MIEEADLRAALAECGTVAEMADRLGTSRQSVYRALSELGLAPPERAGGLTELIRVRVSPEQLDEIDERAKAAGLERSEYVRAAALGRLEGAT